MTEFERNSLRLQLHTLAGVGHILMRLHAGKDAAEESEEDDARPGQLSAADIDDMFDLRVEQWLRDTERIIGDLRSALKDRNSDGSAD